MLTSVWLLGFVIGMQHAFEADHLAAVSAIVSRKRGVSAITGHGVLWGIGHTVALLVVSGIVLLGNVSLPESFGSMLERLVGVVLVVLGAQLVYRLWRDRLHIHVHQHEGGARHLHSHSHRDDPEGEGHDPLRHEHDHLHEHEHVRMRERFEGGVKTLLVGLLHGAAGSAALVVLVAASLDSPAAGILYVLLFGLGSILGMAVLTAVVALPLTATARKLTWANHSLQLAIAVGSVAIGIRFLLGS